mmetsp:Transcript_146671/g.256143  ORF Transcript_146671/g.256143 Transcript_146671/m.256143 type:complete len:164 (-) Transcript_146671:442-933(-)
MAANLVPSLESHAAVLAAEISEIKTDLDQLNILKRKYGPESFAQGDGKLMEALAEKQQRLDQVHRHIHSMQDSVDKTKALAESLGRNAMVQEATSSSPYGPYATPQQARSGYNSGYGHTETPISMPYSSTPSGPFEIVTDSPILAHARSYNSHRISPSPFVKK